MSIKRCLLLILCVLFGVGAFTACSSDPPASEVRGGRMCLPLQTTAPSGNVYQLRSATFSVFQVGATAPTTTLTTSSFNDPSTTLTAPLAVGSYTIQLQTGWQVLRIDASGTETAVSATLTSVNPAGFSITSNQTTNVGFAFNVPGDGSIGFGGNLGVSISVNEGGSGGGGSGTFVLTTGVSGPLGAPSPGFVTGPGINCGTPASGAADCSESITAGSSVQLTATPSGALVFSGWSGAGCTDPAGGTLTAQTIVFTMSQARTCIANFSQAPQQVTLTVQLQSTGGAAVGSVGGPGISCNSSATADCTETFSAGTLIVLDAAATGTSAFTAWSGMTCVDQTGQSGPIRQILMNQNVTCIASFGPTMATFPPAGMTIVGWYSAEAQYMTATAMGTVAQWSDRSGLGHHLTDATGSGRPFFDPTGWAASGQGAVLFQGNQSIATGAALGSRFNGTGVAFSVLAVIRAASDSDGAIATFEQSGTAASFHRMRVSDGGPFLRYQAQSDSGAAATNDENAFLSLTTGNVVSWVNTGTSSILRTDGNAADTGAIALGALNTNLFRVGGAVTGPSLFFNGRIAELIVVSGAITATQYTDFRNYARSRWAGLP